MELLRNQKEILGNRLEYLENERTSALADLDKTEAKLKVFERRRLEIKTKYQNEIELRKGDNSVLARKLR